MSTIAKDYAAELRRISATLFQAGRIDDADELRLAAEYLEQRAKGVALDSEEIEERLSKPELGLANGLSESLLLQQRMTVATQQQLDGGDRDAFLNFLVTLYLSAAAICAVSGVRPGGPLSSEDFLATASDIWFASILEDAVAAAKMEGDAA